MKFGKRALLLLACCGMELSWLCAWANFLALSLLKRPFPLPDALVLFGLAAVITFLSKGKGWRVILVLSLQALGFVFALSRMGYVFDYRADSFWNRSWLLDFFNHQRNFLEWAILVFVSFLTLLFWLGGVTLAKRSTAYLKICSRLDWGLAGFFLLFLVKFLIRVKGGIEINDPISFALLFPFLIFSLLAIGLVRNQSDGRIEFLPGYQGIGVILSFTFLVLVMSTGLVLFFLPYLTMASELGYRILGTGARPLGALFVSLLRFMYFRSNIRPEESPSPRSGSSGFSVTKSETSGWTELAEKILAWGLWGLLGLALLTMCGISVFYLLRWLFSRTSISREPQGTQNPIPRWMAQLRAFLFHLWRKILRSFSGYKGAVQIYTGLLTWGKHSGLPHASSETPREYGLRLRHRFPALKREIEWIVESFNQEVYGEIIPTEEQLGAVKSAWRRLRSPFHWPSRLKSRTIPGPMHYPSSLAGEDGYPTI